MSKRSYWNLIPIMLMATTILVGVLDQGNATILDPPYYEGDVVLYKDSVMRVYADTSDRYYEISGTSALAALTVASTNAGFEYRLNDEWVSSFGLLVYDIAGRANEGYDGWQYWNNFPSEDIPMVSAENFELENTDVLDWFYGGYGFDPDTSSMDIKLHILIQEDSTPPSLEIVSPKKGGLYLFGSELSVFPLSFAVVLGEFHIELNANDDMSSVYRVEIFIDDVPMETMYTAPYHCQLHGIESGLHTLTVKAFDGAGNSNVKMVDCIILSN
jgi:hypothetical protein